MHERTNNAKSQCMVSADHIASERKMTGAELLSLIRATALSPDYPTPECFLPNEVWEYEHTHNMQNGRLAHRNNCASCSALLTALDEPDRSLAEEVAKAGVSQYSPKEHSSSATAAGRRKAIAFAAAAAVFVGVISIGYVRMRYFEKTEMSENSAPAIVTFEKSTPVKLVVTDEISGQQISVLVQAYANGRLRKESYAAAAAATALVNDVSFRGTGISATEEHGNESLANDQLNLKILLALASACRSDIKNVQSPDAVGILEQALKNERLRVQRPSPDRSELLINYGDQSTKLDPYVALSSTIQACELLRQHQGDIRALNNATTKLEKSQ